MNVELPDIESSLELWLSAAADNELNSAQRRQLVRYLDENPRFWRACAVALLDEQILASEVPVLGRTAIPNSSRWYPGVKKSAIPHLTSVEQLRLSRRSTSLRVIAVSLVAMILGFSLGKNLAVSRLNSLSKELESNRSQVDILTDLLISDYTVGKTSTLCSLYPDQPMLLEIQDADGRAIYLTDRPVSEKLLESFYLAGNTVEIRPYQPRIPTSWMQSLSRPVLVVEVEKTRPILFAQGESK